MRIISGKFKGKRLIAPKKLPVRPTTDFAKEALFNILNNRISFSEITFLDLFAGTGNISFEFASRGNKHITAIDADYGCVQFIKKISDELDFEITAIKADVFSFLEKSNQTFDVIFADPPYSFEVEHFEQIPQLIFKNNLLNEEGFIIIEHSKHTDLSKLSNFIESRRYGGSVFSFFQS
ncbi:16S rRNA (guanine(966)-N(2))-methyltransferase RsmD [Planktosalinus lacus]|uniref:Methyltransferase n=1 Tax=Planktosalinus lacus TaxID=1526573 RepID=A0A8J2VBA9_9FLAO|nr:16S rRNA (guanine(966)-N(2))-methyltransferase RsmD [Planktosalinus lacus]GGD98130.1 methyltransferase [Planktosalinus lacus]